MPEKAPLLTLFVGDLYLRRKKIDVFLDQILPKENRLLNFLRIDLKETPVSQILTQARSFPMLGKRQVFLIQNPAELKKDQFVLFEEYFQNPAGWSYLLLEAEQLEEGSPLSKLIVRFGERVDCTQNEKRSGVDFIHRKLKSANRTITKEAWQFLEEKTGGNLTLLDACVEKLMLYVDEKIPIDLPATAKLVDELLCFDSFDLTDAICERNPAKALQVFHFLYDLEGNGMMVIGLLNWQLKRIWQAKVISREKGEGAVARTVRISPYRLPGFLRQVSKFGFDELNEAFHQLFEIDRKLKTGAYHDKVALETFIIELASPHKTLFAPAGK